mgnify:CR=1 FL=1
MTFSRAGAGAGAGQRSGSSAASFEPANGFQVAVVVWVGAAASRRLRVVLFEGVGGRTEGGLQRDGLDLLQ